MKLLAWWFLFQRNTLTQHYPPRHSICFLVLRSNALIILSLIIWIRKLKFIIHEHMLFSQICNEILVVLCNQLYSNISEAIIESLLKNIFVLSMPWTMLGLTLLILLMPFNVCITQPLSRCPWSKAKLRPRHGA